MTPNGETRIIYIDGESLSVDDLMAVGSALHAEIRVELSEDAWQNVRAGRAVIDEIIEPVEVRDEAGNVTVRKQHVVYGINTGFGHFANVSIPPDQLEQLQYNLIRSHAGQLT